MAEKTYARRYRRAGLVWVGQVYRCPSFADRLVDEAPFVLLWDGIALTERGIRRQLARKLWRLTHPPRWKVRSREETAGRG